MLWKKLSKFSAVTTVALSAVYLIWKTINKWLVIGNTESYSGVKSIMDNEIYGLANYVLLSIVTLILGISVILLIVSVTFMIIDTFNRVNNINEPSFLSEFTNRPKQQPSYNMYNQQPPMNNMNGQPPMNMSNQPPMSMNNNIGNQPPMR